MHLAARHGDRASLDALSDRIPPIDHLQWHRERSVINALYAARIEATRHSVPARDRMAAIRALIQERQAAMRAITERKQSALKAIRERRAAERVRAERAREQKSGRPEARDEARPG